ncbi:ATP synthase regulation protein NCA2-domain-containing protein [Staphylotrichum tortipilum]|uniref:ATP synthase regulation protein NCA2-domain-containing protein n=1 Tax=Staphylotrichum tortipilum TaxID=2831512 RepID=A0AAN6MP45_9PEZI|nr:ATP synthase regulation protein NCA2-domain-containing protein [Staphylotrichum longicolle]
MSIVADQVRRLDARVDRVSLVPLTHIPDHDGELHAAAATAAAGEPVAAAALASRRVNELLGIVKALSSGSVSGAHLPSSRIQKLLRQSGLAGGSGGELRSAELLDAKSQAEVDVEWLLVGKATVQTYGLLMSTLLDQIIPLSDGIWYWDEILTSYPYSFVYTVQTSPLRMWRWTREIYDESVERFQRLYRDEFAAAAAAAAAAAHEGSETEEDVDISLAHDDAHGHRPGPTGFRAIYPHLSKHWRQFYGIVRQSVAERSIADIQRRILSRVDMGRSEARQKQKKLRRLREMTATGLGVLLDEGLNFGIADETPNDEWKGMLERSVALMDMVLQTVPFLHLSVSEFEDRVFSGVEEDPELSIHIEDSHPAERPSVLARRLLGLLEDGLPAHHVAISDLAHRNGRPSRLVRYWLPAAILLVSSSTILRILVNRQDDIVNWIRDLGVTARDFWFNWVIDPVRKIVGTIRHDANSEIAIMSRDSLQADRDSLERMVVEFALDNPEIAVGELAITELQIGEIRSKVKEGDVTPVLKAYEKDLRRPFVGAIKGDLVRSLLIQVQKTKVDLEVAISGIDALLKSQELVFGFIGLTPGVLVTIGVIQYLRTMFGSREGMRQGRRARRSVRVLRKIDRILSDATTSQNNIISYRDHGLLVCEVHTLRGLAHGVLPGDVEKEFIEDLDELANLKGIQVQMKALDRIRWAYAEWLGRMR